MSIANGMEWMKNEAKRNEKQSQIQTQRVQTAYVEIMIDFCSV